MSERDTALASVLGVHSLRIEQPGCLPGPAADLGLDPEAILQVSKQLFSVNPRPCKHQVSWSVTLAVQQWTTCHVFYVQHLIF